MADPSSARKAIAVIIWTTVLMVLISTFVMWQLDKEEYPNLGVALWWAVQTVTTVGYGDVAPIDPIGRTVAGLVMLYSVGFVAIVTAVITSAFVESRQFTRRAGADAIETARWDDLDRRLQEISNRLDAMERGSGADSGRNRGDRAR